MNGVHVVASALAVTASLGLTVTARRYLLSFLERRPRRAVDPKERATAYDPFAHRRARGVCAPAPTSPMTPADGITPRYVTVLRRE